ncbi:MAG: hypothetical protein EOP38_10320 [Rubrivivax sp.]|nr:MAG: hypothetical protein EOP38_10320 [Rubrivivax sp.]
MKRCIGKYFSIGLLLWLPTLAQAIKINAPKTEDTATVDSCKSGTHKDCSSKARLSKTSLTGDDAGFKKAFDAWNTTQAAGQKWTLNDGGKAPGGELTTTAFGAKASASVGGLNLIVAWSYAGADKSDYVWSQGLTLNYRPGQSTGAGTTSSFSALDENVFNKLTPCNNADYTSGSSNYFCGPAYPYQYGDRQMNDGPSGVWPDSSFSAYAFISKVDRAKRQLTLFEGFNYGFQLSATAVPEPDEWALALAGAGMVLLARRRSATDAVTLEA